MAQSVTWEQALEILKELKENTAYHIVAQLRQKRLNKLSQKTKAISCSNTTVMNILNKI